MMCQDMINDELECRPGPKGEAAAAEQVYYAALRYPRRVGGMHVLKGFSGARSATDPIIHSTGYVELKPRGRPHWLRPAVWENPLDGTPDYYRIHAPGSGTPGAPPPGEGFAVGEHEYALTVSEAFMTSLREPKPLFKGDHATISATQHNLQDFLNTGREGSAGSLTVVGPAGAGPSGVVGS